MAKSDDRLTLIAAALNGILSRGIEHYKDGPYSLLSLIHI